MNNRIPPIPMMLHIIGNIPTSYAMAMSYEEQLLCLKNYLCEIVVPTMNKNIEEIQTLITYINNYFDNLDLQEEVNNKINEMVKSGELQEIITSYLQMKGVLGFNTLQDLIEATNIIDGSICRTIGNLSYNDGKGEYYKIRKITNDDVVDGVNIIAVDIDNSLIAELIPNFYLSKEIEDRTNSDNNLQNQINEINSKDILLIIGDSWSDTKSSEPFINRNVYPSIVANSINCDIKNYAVHGMQISNMTSQINEAINDNSFIHNKVKYIIIEGGLNDLQHNVSYNNVINSLISGSNTLRNEFINSIIYYVPNLNFPMINTNIGYIQQIENGLKNSKINIIDVLSQMIGQRYFDSTPNSVVGSNNHLTNFGQEVFGRCISNSIKGGNYFMQVYEINTTSVSATSGSGTSGTGKVRIYKTNNNLVNLELHFTNITGLASGVNTFNIDLGEDLINDFIRTNFIDDYGMYGDVQVSGHILTLRVQKNANNTNSRINYNLQFTQGLMINPS